MLGLVPAPQCEALGVLTVAIVCCVSVEIVIQGQSALPVSLHRWVLFYYFYAGVHRPWRQVSVISQSCLRLMAFVILVVLAVGLIVCAEETN